MSNFNIADLLRTGGLSLEEQDDSAEVVEEITEDTTADEIIESASAADDEVAAEVEEVEEGSEELENDAEEVDTATEGVEGLESLISSMESALGDGGMTFRESQFAHSQATALLKRLGVKPAYNLSSEDFAGADDRVTATKLSMESWNDKLKAIVESILKALKAMVAKCKGWWVQLWNSAKNLATRATALEKQAKLLKTDKPVAVEAISKSIFSSVMSWSGGRKDIYSADWANAVNNVAKANNDVIAYVKAAREAIAAFDGELTLPEAVTLPEHMPRGAKFETTANGGIKLVTESFGAKTDGDDITIWMPNKTQLVAALDALRKSLLSLDTFQKEWRASESILNAARSKLEGLFNKQELKSETLTSFNQSTSLLTGLPQGWASYVCGSSNMLLKACAIIISKWDADGKAEEKAE